MDGDCELLTGTACDDGDACTEVDLCNAGACAGNSPVVCAALDNCHEAGACDPATGQCSSPSKPDGSACDDGSACSKVDACQAGVCTGADLVECPALDECHDPGICDPATGLCDAPAKADGSACDDGITCTTGDTCESGVCKSGAANCPAPDSCHLDGACEPSVGQCIYGVVPDGTPCPGGTCINGSCDSSATGSSSSVSSGEASSSSASSAGSAGGGGQDPGDSGGCGCRVAGSPRGGALSALLSMLLLTRARRRLRPFPIA